MPAFFRFVALAVHRLGAAKRLPPLLIATLSLWCALVASATLAETPSPADYSLEQCYRLALARSEIVAGQVALIEQAQARIEQARATFLPNVSLAGTAIRQESPTSALAQNISPADQTTVRANATQNLFKGFRDLATLRQRRLAHRAAEFARDQAEVQLYVDVGQAFFDVQTREAELQNYRSEIGASQERRRELLEFKRSARARSSDLATVDAAIATLDAAIANTTGLLAAARETLSFLTGLPPDAPLAAPANLPDTALTLDYWLENMEYRPDVREARANLQAAEQNIESARAGARPSLDVSANYYLQRPGITEEIDWDVQLSLSQPLFTGGLVQAQVGEAVAQRQANAATLAQAREAADRDIRTLYRTLSANLDQVAKLDRAVALTRRNYELLRQDNRAGLASNIDVLQALANHYQTRRAWENARYATLNNYARLQAISARLTLGETSNENVSSAPTSLPVR